MLKLARRYQIDIYQAITWNYSIAILLTWFFFKPQLQGLQNAPYVNYLVLGVLLPFLFVIIAFSVRITGIVRTDIAQRLSLFIPVVASFLLFSEQLSAGKIAGIVLAFTAIGFSIPQQDKNNYHRTPAKGWLYLLLVFAGMGVIDILFKQIAAFKEVPYTTSLLLVYIVSFVFAIIGLVYRFATKRSVFSWPHIMFGWILGVANFGNILFYLKAHRALSVTPSAVFAAMNIGVIVLGSLVGLFVFKEKLSLLNKIGIGVAIVAIVAIYYVV
ncbi:EamA/RhaT family transporter [Mucilaginibacter gynuensis]